MNPTRTYPMSPRQIILFGMATAVAAAAQTAAVISILF